MITPYDYLSVYQGWHPSSNTGSKIYGLCPIHGERHPSFMIDARDWHWHCFGCDRHGDTVRLVKELEFPLLGEKEWAPVYRRVEELGGLPLPARSHLSVPREEKPAATAEQQAILTVAMLWWGYKLISKMDGEPGRDWLSQADISISPVSSSCEVGYAPKMTSTLFKSLEQMIVAQLGTRDWHDLGKQVGLLREDGTVRLQERVMFVCTNEDGHAVFYQGRSIHDDPTMKRRAKYLGPPHLRKEPFFIPIENPAIEGFCLAESPKGPAAFAADRIPMGATLGSGLDTRMLRVLVKQFGEPVYILTDNDPAEINPETGEVLPGPGEKLAQKAIALCTKEGYECYRVLPPREYKDPDTWRKHEGITPIFTAIKKARQGW